SGVEAVDSIAYPEANVRDDLVIAAAAGVQLATDVAQALDQRPLDVRVDIFQGNGESEIAAIDLAGDVVERTGNLLCLVGREQTPFGEDAGMGLAGADMVAIQAAVERDGLGEGFDAVVGAAAEAAAPGFLAHAGSFSPGASASSSRSCNVPRA